MKSFATYYIMKHFGEQYQPNISLLRISSLFSQGHFAQS